LEAHRDNRGVRGMARTKIPVEHSKIGGYTSVIVSFSTGIDSTGTLHWALQNFPKEMIWLLYCDTGAEYPINEQIIPDVAKFLGIKDIILRHPKGFLELLLTERFKFPDAKNRWCTAILKTGVTDKWIRSNRAILGNKVLFLTGERRDESKTRANLPETEYHSTTLWTKRKGDFECHWHRPVLDFEKGKMFEFGKKLKIDPHPCYEYCTRCSCMMCVLMPDRYAAANIKKHPELIKPYIDAELKLGHTWKNKKSLGDLFKSCIDIDDMVEG
jgi:3'-phosphoadenosine 5'-phosphosulfate sulfotransferase (PAPS reductase)/FAD synthetase